MYVCSLPPVVSEHVTSNCCTVESVEIKSVPQLAREVLGYYIVFKILCLLSYNRKHIKWFPKCCLYRHTMTKVNAIGLCTLFRTTATSLRTGIFKGIICLN